MISKVIVDKKISHLSIQFAIQREDLYSEIIEAEKHNKDFIEIKFSESYRDTMATVYLQIPIFIIEECVGSFTLDGFKCTLTKDMVRFYYEFSARTHLWWHARMGMNKKIYNSCKIHFENYLTCKLSYSIRINIPKKLYRRAFKAWKKNIKLVLRDYDEYDY